MSWLVRRLCEHSRLPGLLGNMAGPGARAAGYSARGVCLAAAAVILGRTVRRPALQPRASAPQ